MKKVLEKNSSGALKSAIFKFPSRDAFKGALVEDVKQAVIAKLGLPDNYGTDQYNNGQYAKEHPGTDINTNILNVELLKNQVQDIGSTLLPNSQIVLGEDLLNCYITEAENALGINKTQAHRLPRNLNETNRAIKEFSGYLDLKYKKIKTLADFLPVFERRIDEIYKVATFCKFIDPNNFEKEFETVNAAKNALNNILKTCGLLSDFNESSQLKNAATHQETVNCIYEAIYNYVIEKNLIDKETLFALNPNIENAIGTNDSLSQKASALQSQNQLEKNKLNDALNAKSFIKEFSKYNVDRNNYTSDEDFKVADKTEFKDRVRKLFDKIKGPYLAKEYCSTITVDDEILDSMYESMYNIKKSLGKTSLEQNDTKISITDEIKHYFQVFLNCLVKLKNLVFSAETELFKSDKELKNNVIGKYKKFIIDTIEKVNNITLITF